MKRKAIDVLSPRKIGNGAQVCICASVQQDESHHSPFGAYREYQTWTNMLVRGVFPTCEVRYIVTAFIIQVNNVPFQTDTSDENFWENPLDGRAFTVYTKCKMLDPRLRSGSIFPRSGSIFPMYHCVQHLRLCVVGFSHQSDMLIS